MQALYAPFIIAPVGLQIKRYKMSITETESNITLTKQYYETIAKEIYSAISKYRDMQVKLATMGLVLTMNHKDNPEGSAVRIRSSKRKEISISVAGSVMDCLCEMYELTWKKAEQNDAQENLVGFVSGFSHLSVRYGWPMEIEECLIVIPLEQTGPHAEHFLAGLVHTESTITIDRLLSRHGLQSVMLPYDADKYMEISPYSGGIVHRDRAKDQALAYMNWVAWGSNSIDMSLLEKFVLAHIDELGAATEVENA